MKRIIMLLLAVISAFIAGYLSAIYISNEKVTEMRQILSDINENITEHRQAWLSAELDANIENLNYLVRADSRMEHSEIIVRNYIPTVENSISKTKDNLQFISSDKTRGEIEGKISRGNAIINEIKFNYGM